jgi:carbon monoxide dehydrogenase subunit G
VARIEHSIEIKRTPDKVFAFVTDPKSWPRWNPDMLEAEQTSSGPATMGATFRGANKVMGLRMPWTAKATEYVPNKKWGETITLGSTVLEEHLTFDPAGAGTKFTAVFDVKVGGFLRLFAPMMTSSMRKGMKKSQSTLKGILESQV